MLDAYKLPWALSRVRVGATPATHTIFAQACLASICTILVYSLIVCEAQISTGGLGSSAGSLSREITRLGDSRLNVGCPRFLQVLLTSLLRRC
jgi:hypothetical protein